MVSERNDPKRNPCFLPQLEAPAGFVDRAEHFHFTARPEHIGAPEWFRIDHRSGKWNFRVVVDINNPTRAFKIRGATAAVMASAGVAGERTPIVVASSGNFGRGVSHASYALGIEAHVFMAANTPTDTVESIRSHGGTPKLVGATYDEAKVEAIAFARNNGYSFLDGVSWEVYSGNYGLGLEIKAWLSGAGKEEAKGRVAVVLPVGIASLLVPLKLAFRDLDIDLVAMEPVGYAKYPELIEGAANAHGPTLARGCAVVGFPPFSKEQALACPAFYGVVSDEENVNALRMMHADHGILLEGAGSLAIAGVMAASDFFAQFDTVIAIATGANHTADIRRSVLEHDT
jgi:threonine dehydratase